MIRAGLIAAVQAAPAMADEMPAASGRITCGPAHVPGASNCTGTLVAPAIVLTSAHCVRGGIGDPQGIPFAAGCRDGQALATARGAKVILAAGTALAADAALVRLDRPLPPSIAPLPLQAAGHRLLSRFAYRRDRPGVAEANDICMVLSRTARF